MTTKKYSLLLEAVFNRSVLRPYRPEDSEGGDVLKKASTDDHSKSEEESKSGGRGDPSDKKGVDDHSKTFGEKTEKQGEKEKGEGEGEGEGEGKESNDKSDKSGSRSSSSGDRSSQAIKQQQPKFNWRVLIKQALAKSIKLIPEETRSKYSRRTMSQIGIMQSKKAAAVMPAEKNMEIPDLKIAFILDVSGSMMGHYSKCFSEIHSAMTSKDMAGASCTFLTYSTGVEAFYVDLVKQRGRKINSLSERTKKTNTGTGISVNDLLFNADVGGGTNLDDPTLLKYMEDLMKEGPIILMTDEDVWYRIEHMKKLMQNPNFMMILASKQIYDEFVKRCGGSISTKITHF